MTHLIPYSTLPDNIRSYKIHESSTPIYLLFYVGRQTDRDSYL